MFQSLAAYFQDSPGLVRTGPGLVRLKVAHENTRPELDQSLPILGSLGIQIFVSTGCEKEGLRKVYSYGNFGPEKLKFYFQNLNKIVSLTLVEKSFIRLQKTIQEFFLQVRHV